MEAHVADLQRLWERGTWVFCEAAVCCMLPGLVRGSRVNTALPAACSCHGGPGPAGSCQRSGSGAACSVFLAWALTAFQLQSWNTLTGNSVTFGTIPSLPLPCSCAGRREPRSLPWALASLESMFSLDPDTRGKERQRRDRGAAAL